MALINIPTKYPGDKFTSTEMNQMVNALLLKQDLIPTSSSNYFYTGDKTFKDLAQTNELLSKIDNGYSITQLRNLPDSKVISTQLFYCSETGKEGFWKYDSTDTSSTDNLGIVLVTSTGKRLKRIIEDYIYSEWFKKEEDLSHSECIQRAIDYCNSNGIEEPYGVFSYKTVKLRDNYEYSIDKTIVLNQYVKLDLGTSRLTINSYIPAVIETPIDKLHIKGGVFGRGCLIDCQQKANIGVHIKWCSEFSIEGIYIENPIQISFKFGQIGTPTPSYGLIGVNLQGDKQRPNQTVIGSKGVLLENITDSKIITSVMISSETGFESVNQTASNSFISCHAWARLPESYMNTCYVLGGSSKAIDCYADTPNIYGFHLVSGRHQLLNCNVYNNQFGGSQLVGIRIENESKYCTVIQTKFTGIGTKEAGKWIKKDIEFGATYDPEFDGHIVQYSSFDKVETRTNFISRITDDTNDYVVNNKVRAVNEIKKHNQVIVGDEFRVRATNPNNFVNPTIIDAAFQNGFSTTRGYITKQGALSPFLMYQLEGDDVVFYNLLNTEVFRLKDVGLQINNGSYLLSGLNNPNGFKSAPLGSFYMRTNGGLTNSHFFKVNGGSSNNGWKSLAELTQNNIVNLADLSSITPDCIGGLYYVFRITLGGNRTIQNPTNLTDAQEFAVEIKQDVNGNRRPIWGSKYSFSLTGYNIDVNPNYTTFLKFQYNQSADKCFCTSIQYESPKSGSLNLENGTIIVPNKNITPDTIIIIQTETTIGVQPHDYNYTRNPGVGFTINAIQTNGSLETGCNSKINYLIV